VSAPPASTGRKPPNYAEIFAEAVKATKANRKAIFEEDCATRPPKGDVPTVIREITATRFRNNALPNQSLFSDAGSVVTVDRAAAAINIANEEGVKGGVSVAPLAFIEPKADKLSGGERPRLTSWFRQSLVIRVATLEDLGIRLAAGMNIHFAPEIDWPKIWQAAEACREDYRTPRKKGDESRLDAAVAMVLGEDTGKAFASVCGSLLEVFEDEAFAKDVTAKETVEWREKISAMTYTCRGEMESNPTFVVSGITLQALGANGENLRTHLLNRRKHGALDDTRYDRVLDALGRVEKELGTLSGIMLPTAPNTLDTDRELRPAYRQAVWEATQGRVGIEAQLDLTEINWGFRPIKKTDGYPSLEREPLGRGRPSSAVAKVSGLIKRRRLEATLGFGFGFRDDLDDNRRIIYVPNGSLSVIVGSLEPRHRLVEKASKQLRLKDDGEMPAYIVVGVDLALRFMPGRPSYQEQVIDEAKATLFFDIRFTKSVGVRLGLPVKAEMILQEAITTTTPMVPRDAGRRWTVPAFITTVIGF